MVGILNDFLPLGTDPTKAAVEEMSRVNSKKVITKHGDKLLHLARRQQLMGKHR